MTMEQAAFQFVRWALTEGPWSGNDLDGAAVQEKAIELGLVDWADPPHFAMTFSDPFKAAVAKATGEAF